jgi:diguanylate cyclase (GGDEF)-like protein/PAS domain S-box-containing protein
MKPPALPPYEAFFDLLLDAVCAVDADGRFVFVSAAVERILGYTPQELIGRRMIDLVAPEDHARTLARVDEVVSDAAASPHFENRYVHKAGHYVDIMWSARWSEADQLRVAVARDVTERKRADALRAAMYAISEAANAASSLPHLFPLLHHIVDKLLPAPGFAIALYNGKDDLILLPYHVDEHGATGASSMAAADTLCGHVIKEGRALLLTPESLASLPPALHADAGRSSPCWLGVPLVSRKEGTIGAIIVTSLPGPRQFGQNALELLHFVADQVGTAIERVRMQEQLQHMARHDALTGLPNRQLFLDRLDAALARAVRSGGGFALLYLDLDGFKQVNDRHGHAAGDALLCEVARRVQQAVRDVDTVGRIGGDEFVVLLEGVDNPTDAALIAAKIGQRFERPISAAGQALQISPSIGHALYPFNGVSAAQLLEHADIAMYRAKHSRRATTAACAPAQDVSPG